MNNQSISSLYNFRNKIILISGSTGQIGESFVKLFLELGALVFGFDNRKSKLNNKNFFFTKINITNKKLIKKKISQIINKNNKIDVIINSAAVSIFTKYTERTEQEINNSIDTNIKGTLNIINAYVEEHKKRHLKKCSIINLGSIYGFLSPDFRIYGKNDRYSSEIYGATKASVIQLTKYYSVILSKYNINVNCLSPGGVLNKRSPQNKYFIKKYSNRIPKRRMGNVEDLYTGILFLASDHSNYVCGQNIIVDGGLSVW